MTRQFKTASTRLEKEAWEKYNAKCAERGITPFTDIKKYIESVLDEQRGSIKGVPEHPEAGIEPVEAPAASGAATKEWRLW